MRFWNAPSMNGSVTPIWTSERAPANNRLEAARRICSLRSRVSSAQP
jgi:hypothetical protein